MGDFEATWRLTRQRFDDAVLGLTAEQLNWRPHEGALTLGEMAIHVAGVETSFIAQLTGDTLDDARTRVKNASTDGVINDLPFPFTEQEITPEFVAQALAEARKMTDPIISNPTPEIRSKQIVSALGPVIDGTGAFARLAYHPGYHQGQAHVIKTTPGFPG